MGAAKNSGERLREPLVERRGPEGRVQASGGGCSPDAAGLEFQSTVASTGFDFALD